MGTSGVRRTGIALTCTVGLGLIVAGCGATPAAVGPPAAGSTASQTPTAPPVSASAPSPTPTPTPALTPAPVATPVPVPAATCDTVLVDAEYARFETDGLTFRDGAESANLDALMEPGGISCLWRVPNTDIEAWYAQWPSDQATWDALSAELLAAGGAEADDAYAGVLQPEYNAELTYRDGIVYYASPARLFSSVPALQ